MSLQDPRKVLEEMDGAQKKEDEGSQDLPPITKLYLDVVGTRGKRYQHTFVYKVPNLGDQVKMAQLKAEYLPRGAAADPNGFVLVDQVSYLSVTLDAKSLPKWWDVWSLYDATPISALYKEAIEYERRFHGIQTPSGQAGDGQGLAAPGRSDDSGVSEKGDAVVGEEVPTPPQRRKVIASSGG